MNLRSVPFIDSICLRSHRWWLYYFPFIERYYPSHWMIPSMICKTCRMNDSQRKSHNTVHITLCIFSFFRCQVVARESHKAKVYWYTVCTMRNWNSAVCRVRRSLKSHAAHHRYWRKRKFHLDWRYPRHQPGPRAAAVRAATTWKMRWQIRVRNSSSKRRRRAGTPQKRNWIMT